jgi:hypothetical protein
MLTRCGLLHAVGRPGGKKDADVVFRAHDKDTVRQLPACLRLEFPYIITHRAAIHKNIMQSLSTAVISPASFAHYATTIHEAHANSLLVKQEQMASLARSLKESGSVAQQQLQPLPSKVVTQGPAYLINIYLHGLDERLRRKHYELLMRLTHSPILRFDHCHKPNASIRMAGGAKAAEGTCFCVGTHMQIMSFHAVKDTKLTTVQNQLQKLAERSAELGSVRALLHVLCCCHLNATRCWQVMHAAAVFWASDCSYNHLCCWLLLIGTTSTVPLAMDLKQLSWCVPAADRPGVRGQR